MALTAYLLVFTIATKLFIEAIDVPGMDFHSQRHPEAWAFWGTMAACIFYGLSKKRKLVLAK